MSIKLVVLAGGMGSRLWPISSINEPKQFIKTFGNYSLLQKTLIRNAKYGKPIVIVNTIHLTLAKAQVKELNIEVDFIVEPYVKNTAPACIIACLTAQAMGYDNIILVPCDHYIEDIENYHLNLKQSIDNLYNHKLSMIGINITNVDSNYGYIKIKEKVSDNTFIIDKFIEKPTYEVALQYAQTQNYFWNSGIFIFDINYILQQTQRINPKLYNTAINTYKNSIMCQAKTSIIRLQSKHYKAIEAISFDIAIIQNIEHMVMVKSSFKWMDIGGLENFITKALDSSNNDNSYYGNVITHLANNSHVSAGDKVVTLIGMDNIMLINTQNSIFVINKDYIKDLSNISSKLSV